MKRKETIFAFDCEKMKHPNTGLFNFCDYLGKALKQEAKRREKRIMFFVPRIAINYFGNDVKYKRVYKCLRLFFPKIPNVKVWHASFQRTKYLPQNTKIVLTIHDLNFLYENKNDKEKSKFQKRIQENIDKSDVVVAISEFVKEDIEEKLDTKGKVVKVIYNGCIFQKTQTEPKIKPSSPFLFTLGTVCAKKNFKVLPCLLQNNNYQLIIAGIRNSEDYEREIMEEAAIYNVADRVHIVGTITNAEKAWYLENCSAFLFPSIAEGFGLPVLEALFHKKPTFTSDYTSLPEIGKSYTYYFNHHFDRKLMQQEFEQGMLDFEKIENKDLLMEHALSFSWEKAAKQYWDLYESLV